MKKKSFLMIAAFASLLVSCGGGSNGMMNLGDDEFPVQAAQVQDASMQTSYPATIKGIKDVEIRPKVAGFITKVLVKEGQVVSAGQVLFEIDNETYKASVRQAQAAVNAAQAQTRTAQLTYDNSQKLFEKNVIGSFELQSVQNTLEAAKAQLAQAQAALVTAKESLSWCYVKSPSAGVVGTLPYKLGAMVSSANALTNISSTEIVEAFFSLPEKEILAMSKTQGGINAAISAFPNVQLLLSDGTIYETPGKVSKVSGNVDAATGSVQVIAQFANPKRLLKSGGSGSILIPRTNNNAIVIPQNVVVEVQNKMFVYVLGNGNKVKYTEITVDPQNDGKHYVVRSGLNVGDKYVTNGVTKLTDGQEIKPITPAQYAKKIEEATKLSENQGSLDGFKKSMGM